MPHGPIVVGLYSHYAKQVVIVDVVVIAIGFVLRAYAGGVAIDVAVSPWLVFITFVLALMIALARRRHADCARRGRGRPSRAARRIQRQADRSDAFDRRGCDAGGLHDLHGVTRSCAETRHSAFISYGACRRFRDSALPVSRQ